MLCMQDTLLDVLSRFGCRSLPTPNNLVSTIECVSEYEFLIKPAAAITLIFSGLPKAHRFDVLRRASNRVYGYLTQMVGNVDPDSLRAFLRFVSGSSVCSATELLTIFQAWVGDR